MSLCVSPRCAALGVCNCAAPRHCGNCRYWSEMCARSEGASILALCLAPEGTNRGRFIAGANTCPSWASDHLGAVDQPGEPPNYEAEAA